MKIELLKTRSRPFGRQGRHGKRRRYRPQRRILSAARARGTAERVKEHFGAMVKGAVERFELPNLRRLNFLLHESLGGGGTFLL
jgi:hypothetical protein